MLAAMVAMVALLKRQKAAGSRAAASGERLAESDYLSTTEAGEPVDLRNFAAAGADRSLAGPPDRHGSAHA